MKVQACHIALKFGVNTRKKITDTKTGTYNAPPGWIISKYSPVITKDVGPTNYQVSFVAADSNFISNSELNEAYKEASDFLVSLSYKGATLGELKGKLDNSYSQFKSYRNQISASHQTIELIGTIRGAGITYGGTRLSMHLSAELSEMPNELTDISALRNNFKSIIEDFVKENPQEENSDTTGLSTIEHESFESQVVFFENNYFAVNKFEQLVRIYYQGDWKTEIIAGTVAVVNGSIRTSDKHKTLYTLSDDGGDILIVQCIDGNWNHGVIDAWGGKIITSSFKASSNEIGVFGLNEDGQFVLTYQDGNGSQIPDGNKISFAILNETKDLA